MNLKFLIVLVYYQRPSIFLNALESIKNLDYDNWELVFIDDGSIPESEGENIVKEHLKDYLHKIKFYYINDSVEQKIIQGGSRHGEYMNKAILESDSDAVIILCDDDALISNYLTNLNNYFNTFVDKNYCYSHVIVFNPLTENPFEKKKTEHWTNRFGDINPVCNVDSAQVVYRTKCIKEDGLRYLSPQTKNLDAEMFKLLVNKYGLCSYTGFDSQYKAYFDKQLGNKNGINQYIN